MDVFSLPFLVFTDRVHYCFLITFKFYGKFKITQKRFNPFHIFSREGPFSLRQFRAHDHSNTHGFTVTTLRCLLYGVTDGVTEIEFSSLSLFGLIPGNNIDFHVERIVDNFLNHVIIEGRDSLPVIFNIVEEGFVTI